MRWGHLAFGQSEVLERCCKGRCQQKLLQSCVFTSQGFEEMHSWVWFMWIHFSDSNSLWIWASKGFSNSRSNSLKAPNLTLFQLWKWQETVNLLFCFGYQSINHGVGVLKLGPEPLCPGASCCCKSSQLCSRQAHRYGEVQWHTEHISFFGRLQRQDPAFGLGILLAEVCISETEPSCLIKDFSGEPGQCRDPSPCSPLAPPRGMGAFPEFLPACGSLASSAKMYFLLNVILTIKLLSCSNTFLCTVDIWDYETLISECTIFFNCFDLLRSFLWTDLPLPCSRGNKTGMWYLISSEAVSPDWRCRCVLLWIQKGTFFLGNSFAHSRSRDV